jgi:hypothetical protein
MWPGGVSGLAEVIKDELTEDFGLLERREVPSSRDNTPACSSTTAGPAPISSWGNNTRES